MPSQPPSLGAQGVHFCPGFTELQRACVGNRRFLELSVSYRTLPFVIFWSCLLFFFCSFCPSTETLFLSSFTKLSEIVPLSLVCSDNVEGPMRMTQFLYIKKCHHCRVPFGGRSPCSRSYPYEWELKMLDYSEPGCGIWSLLIMCALSPWS